MADALEREIAVLLQSIQDVALATNKDVVRLVEHVAIQNHRLEKLEFAQAKEEGRSEERIKRSALEFRLGMALAGLASGLIFGILNLLLK